MKIYISGRITGLPQNEYMDNFMRSEMWLKARGYSVINPAKVNQMLPIDTTYEQYMAMSFCMLDMCDAIYMMSNWTESKGAKMEIEQAKAKGMKIMYESEVNA